MIYDPGTHGLPTDTKHLAVLIRIQVRDPHDEAEAEIVNRLQDLISIKAGSADEFPPLQWDRASLEATTRTMASSGAAHRYGTVVEVREDIHRTEGNPAAGAAAGAIVGGTMARRPLAGAAGGAAIGAGMSRDQPRPVAIRFACNFEDGSMRTFAYEGGPRLHPGDQAMTTQNGRLARR